MPEHDETRKDRRRRTSRNLRSRKVRAVLASGLVLGVGATITLAAWNDSEYAQGSLEAGTFAIMGSVDGENFDEMEPEAHRLNFTAAADQMYPGAQTYASFSVRTRAGSMAGLVHVTPAMDEQNILGLGEYLSYGIREIPSADCTSESFENATEPENQVAPQGTRLTSDIEDQGRFLAANSQSTVNYCVELSLDAETPNDMQGEQSTPQWEFQGTSVSE